MPIVRWLHVSDLHLNKTGVESTRIRKNLPIYLKSLRCKFDYVFCSGDLRYAPVGRFSEDTLEYLQSLCESVSVPLGNLFITPGNHDVERENVARKAAIEEEWCSNKAGKYVPNVGVFQEEHLVSIMHGTDSYRKCIEKIHNAQKEVLENDVQSFGPHTLIICKDFNILELDSTLVYMEDQESNLVVGTDYLYHALEKCDKSKPTVILTHYSFDYLDRDEQNQIAEILREFKVRLWLSGHEHNQLLRVQRDYFYEFQCGNLMLEDGARTCVLLGELDTETGNGRISMHAWFSPRGWAEYPLVGYSPMHESNYLFSLHEKDVRDDKDERRKSLRTEISCLLRENESIFTTYGPTEVNRKDIYSEYHTMWENELRKTIIPNSQKVIMLLTENQEILLDAEKEILEKYKQHVQGLQINHSETGAFMMDAPRFPQEIWNILK